MMAIGSLPWPDPIRVPSATDTRSRQIAALDSLGDDARKLKEDIEALRRQIACGEESGK